MRNAKTIAFAMVALASWALPTIAQAAPPVSDWKLNLISMPTNLKPGTTGSIVNAPVYLLYATNVGGAPTNGTTVTYSATFPEGVTPVATKGGDNDSTAVDPTCKIAGQTVICTTSAAVQPSRLVKAQIGVAVTGGVGALADATAEITGGDASPTQTSTPTRIEDDPPPFGFLVGSNGLSARLTNADGSPGTQAGSHPDQMTIDIGFPVEQASISGSIYTNAGHPRDILTELPRGLVVNPSATERCTEVELLVECVASAQVGMVTVATPAGGPQPTSVPLYNMVPPPGSPAALAFNVAGVGVYAHVKGGVRSDGDYGLTAINTDTLAKGANPILGVQVQLWADPTDASHDQVRGPCAAFPEKFAPCKVEGRTTAFLTMPSQCTQELTFGVRARSWEESEDGIEGLLHSAQAAATDLEGNSIGVTGCSQQSFGPTIEANPTTSIADSPTGFDFTLHQPQDQELGHIAPANLKDATVTLPEGLVVNPSQADGLEACAFDQIGYLGEGRYSKDPDTCPDASKVGSLEVATPLLDHPLPGSVYVAEPFENEFSSLLAIYLVIDDPASGTVAKLAGEVIPDPVTGQLTSRFEENPQLPLEDVRLRIFGGSRASLITPFCGTHQASSDLVPWSTPEGEDAHPADSFAISSSPIGGSCPSSEAEAPVSLSFSAGTILPVAGTYSTFVLNLSRNDATQRITGFDMTLPAGLTGKLAGVGTCSDAAIAIAETKTGQEELASPSCPADSLIGKVDVGAGAGPTPYYTTGKIYMAGPFKGAPLSAVAITPAVAGPFDLGTVAVRVPTYLDPITSVLSVKNGEEFPHILEGIPLELRDARLALDRDQFTLNPTSCSEKAITGEAISLLGKVAPLSERFQVGGCRGLDYAPKLHIRLYGKTKRGAHPRLRAILEAKPGEEANTKRASVALPKSEFLENAHIQTVCTRVQFAADQCPAGSIYGNAKAITPLLDEPLEGPVYLRSSDNELPDMVAALKGPPSRPIEVELKGRIDSVNGGIRSTFDLVPDQPVTKFILNMKGGNKGLIVNSRNICAHTYKARAKFDGQNGKFHDFKTKLKADCKGKGKKAKGKARRR